MGIIDESNADVFAMALTDSDAMPGVEAATYYVFGNTNGVSLNLQVNRQIIDLPSEMGNTRTHHITAFMGANTNIVTVNTAGDAVSLPPVLGQPAARLSVIEIINQSPAGWLLLLR